MTDFHIWARVEVIDDLHHVFVTAMPAEPTIHPMLDMPVRATSAEAEAVMAELMIALGTRVREGGGHVIDVVEESDSLPVVMNSRGRPR